MSTPSTPGTPGTPTEDAARDARHRQRMQRKKTVVDGKIAAAETERGLALLRDAAAQKTKFATQPAEVQGELFGEGEEGITWKIHLVLSGDNFAAEMEEECGAAEIFVVRSNGAGYGFSRPSSASSTSTEPAPDMPPSSPSASPSSAPLPLGRPESAV